MEMLNLTCASGDFDIVFAPAAAPRGYDDLVGGRCPDRRRRDTSASGECRGHRAVEGSGRPCQGPPCTTGAPAVPQATYLLLLLQRQPEQSRPVPGLLCPPTRRQSATRNEHPLRVTDAVARILELVAQRRAVVWPGVEALLAELRSVAQLLQPHVLRQARTKLLREGALLRNDRATRGGRNVITYRFASA